MQPRHLLCTQCGAETSAPLKLPPGSPWVALVLAVPFVIPGLVYTVWRYTMRRTVCPTCGHAQLIPGDAPLARAWRSAGWLPGRPPAREEEARPVTAPDIRLDRIEQAIDAIASEVDRIAQHQHQHQQQQQRGLGGSRAEHDAPSPPRLRDRGTVTPA